MSLTDRVQQTTQAARRLWNRKQRQQDYVRTFGSPHGRRVLMHLMVVNGILDSAARTPDPAVSLVQDGRRQAVLAILSHLRIDENAVLTAVSEGNDALFVNTDELADIG